MIDQASVPSLLGSTVRDTAGDKIGKVGQVYLDDTSGMPEWVTVRTGLFGTRESFVPLAAARVEGDELVVDVPKDRVGEAPQIDEDGHLSEEQEAELYRYYGVDPGPFGRLPDEDLAEPSAGAMDEQSAPAVGTLQAPSHEALPDSGPPRSRARRRGRPGGRPDAGPGAGQRAGQRGRAAPRRGRLRPAAAAAPAPDDDRRRVRGLAARGRDDGRGGDGRQRGGTTHQVPPPPLDRRRELNLHTDSAL